MKKVVFSFFAVVIAITVFSQEKFNLKKDLRGEWLVHDGKGYRRAAEVSDRGFDAVHFNFSAAEFPGAWLQITNYDRFFLFVDGKLVRNGHGRMMLSVDSLATAFRRRPVTISIYQKDLDTSQLATVVVTPSSAQTGAGIDEKKPDSDFRDFVVAAGLGLILFFVAMLRLQPKLAADYFSIRRVLSLRETDDPQGHVRFAISSNLWFYIFCSMMTALVMMMLFYHLRGEGRIANDFAADSLGAIFVQWFRLSAFVLMILIARIAVIFVLSTLFGFAGIAGMHSFNVLRVVMIVASTLAVVTFIYFISRGNDPQMYGGLLLLLAGALICWTVLAFFKLAQRSEHSLFHLFSYICATEVIPLLITIKVLFR